ncbi:DUF1015 family protein [Streptomyces nanhaiensis]|uniref:DUF1015 family protein n=1 Tax=Streptomyces nanhaiensis TaxID=679319 RepID=UPI00399D3F09
MPTPSVPTPEPTPLRLRPFRAVRYDQNRVGELSALLAPPHDDLDPARIRELRGLPHHITRLLYTRDPRTAARELRRWLQRGVLRRDEQPALYVYQQRRGARILQRGLIGELQLPSHGTGRADQVLPHEDVSPAVVGQRAAHMADLRAQLEPLLLTYQGTASTATQVMDHITRRPPVAIARIAEITHTLWSCSDEDTLPLITSGLSGTPALIADGHHRYAACLGLGGESDSPWSSSLALLVDSTAHPLRLAAIHRVMPGLEPEKAAATAAEVARVRPLPDGPRPPDQGELVLVGAGRAWTITDPDPRALREALTGRPKEWTALPTAVSDHLLTAAWSVPDLPGAVRYLHDARQAADVVASPGSGSALLLPALTEDRVRQLAEAGVLLPRKSTSFGPKPAAGLALRVLGLP